MSTTDKPLDWGAAPDLNALEVVMWRAEVDPALRSTVLALEELDVAPDWQRFRAAHEWGSRRVPRFRQRIVDGPLGLGQPTWVVDGAFELDYHVRRVALPDGGTWTDLLALVGQLGMAPFDRTRPPWEATLIEGLPDGRAAYALKMHHATLDGAAGMQLLSGLHSRRREPSPDKAQPPPPEPGDATALGAVTRRAAQDVRGAAGAVAGAPGRLLRLGRPDHAVRDAARWTQSLQRVLGGSGATPSPLLAGRSGTWNLQAADVAFADLRAAAKSAGASLNDAFLAALLGAFRRYHEALGVPIDTMPVAIPINVRKPDDPDGGNRFAAGQLAGPVGMTDPVERMHAVGALVRAARDEPALEGLGVLAPLLARLPGPAIAHVVGGMTGANDLQASNVPGLRDDVYLAGAKVERLYPYAPLPGCAAMIVLMTHGETCCIAANLDPASVSEPETFGRCLVEGFGEVLDLVPGAAPAVLRT